MSNEPKPRPLILLLEDEAPLATLICESLAGEYEVEVAGTVEEARLLLGQDHDPSGSFGEPFEQLTAS